MVADLRESIAEDCIPLLDGLRESHNESHASGSGLQADDGSGETILRLAKGNSHGESNAPAPHESFDYEIIESAIADEEWRSRTKLEMLQYTAIKWLFVLLVGLSMGTVAFFINTAVENVGGLKFGVTALLIQRGSFFAGFLTFATIDLFLVLSASLLCNLIAPEAAGSGIPDVKAYLNGVDTPRMFAFKTLVVKILGSIGTVAGGLAVGKEGPLIHTGACIANILGQGGSRKYHLTSRYLSYFNNDRDRRDLVTCGAAAGVAGAFRAPVGGVLFALEEATSWWRNSLLWRVFFTNAVVAVVLRSLMAYCEDGACGPYSSGGLIIFETRETKAKATFGLLELTSVTVLGVVGGILGGLFNQLNVALCRHRQVWRDSKWKRVAEACIIAALTSAVRFGVPLIAPCLECPEGAASQCPSATPLGPYKRFGCPDGHYNDLASLLFATNEDAVRHLFNSGTDYAFTGTSLFLFFLSFYFLSIITYGIVVPSGLFVPAIVNGAICGRMCGTFMRQYFPASTLGPGTYSLLGSAAFLGGTMRMTVSLCIILLELTGSLQLLPLIMIVLLVSKSVGDVFSDNIYDAHMQLKGIPFLSSRPEQAMRDHKARDCISSTPVTFNGVESVGKIVETLRTRPHNAFPVITRNDDGSEGSSFVGMILRSHLLVLLQSKKAFQEEQVRSSPEVSRMSMQDFRMFWSGRSLRIEEIEVSEAEKRQFIDLHVFSNRSTYLVPENMTVTKVYMLFRKLGLRHLCVVPRPDRILGVITRKDLLPKTLDS